MGINLKSIRVPYLPDGMFVLMSSRAEGIARPLVETNMTIGEIAAASGFDADAHVTRFFSRRTGLTPLAYRKQHRMP